MFNVSGRVLVIMGHSKGRDNAKKRARRRKKTERLALAKRPSSRSRGTTSRQVKKAEK